GVEPFLIAATLESIIAQRLIRKICLQCRLEYQPSDGELMELNLRRESVKDRLFYYGKGCDNCNHTGYKGRTAIFEIMAITDSIKELIIAKASTGTIRDKARLEGMKTLRDSAMFRLYEGTTTIEEVLKATQFQDTIQ
ncbi:MAG: pilus assembly protein PilB, partial [Planctomycetota bacterium]